MQTIDKIVCARTLTEERKETENLVRSGGGSVNDFKWQDDCHSYALRILPYKKGKSRIVKTTLFYEHKAIYRHETGKITCKGISYKLNSQTCQLKPQLLEKAECPD